MKIIIKLEKKINYFSKKVCVIMNLYPSDTININCNEID